MIKKNIAIVLAKHESSTFNRYMVPVLGRPIATYPLLASRHCDLIDDVYLLTDSESLSEHVKNQKNIRIFPRAHRNTPLSEEIRSCIQSEAAKESYTPNTVTILFANSPCVHADHITNAIRLLDQRSDIDSVVSAMRRSEFEPSKVFSIAESGLLRRMSSLYTENLNAYFLDKRYVVVRWSVLENMRTPSDLVEGLLGASIHPVIQDEGVWDIDYAWQIPGVERWLRQNSFTDEKTPYDGQKPHSVSAVPPSAKRGEELKILISTVPFGQPDRAPLELLEKTPGTSYVINPLGRKFKEDEIAEYIKDYDILIAGTEKISRKVLENARKLKLISRVGIGLDSVDLETARKLGIRVTYTPEAPAPAVAELTVAHMLNLLRGLPVIDRKMRSGVWQRITGERLANQTVGIIGTGRVGKRVIKLIQGFHPKAVLVNDLNPDLDFYKIFNAVYAEKEEIFRTSDIISIHVPLTHHTRDLVTSREMRMMKKTGVLINTSRGGIVNEEDLYGSLRDGTLAGAALDVFEEEPYTGKLVEIENCLISCHMGSMTNDCRAEMERLATEDAVRFVMKQPLLREVPEEEYLNAGSA